MNRSNTIAKPLKPRLLYLLDSKWKQPCVLFDILNQKKSTNFLNIFKWFHSFLALHSYSSPTIEEMAFSLNKITNIKSSRILQIGIYGKSFGGFQSEI